MRMLIVGYSPAKELDTRANQKICGYNRIRVDGWKRFEYAACGRENFRIRKKIFEEKKISGYVWTWPKCSALIFEVVRNSFDVFKLFCLHCSHPLFITRLQALRARYEPRSLYQSINVNVDIYFPSLTSVCLFCVSETSETYWISDGGGVWRRATVRFVEIHILISWFLAHSEVWVLGKCLFVQYS